MAGIRQARKIASASTQMYLKVGEIKDNILILKDSGLRAIIKTSSVNFALKSDQEQKGIIYAYQAFLNSLEFPIQILIKSHKVNIESYVDNLKERAKKEDNPLLRDQIIDYTEHIIQLVEYADIMKKDFYVIVSYDPPGINRRGFVNQFMSSLMPQDSIGKLKKRLEEFEAAKKVISQRASLIKSGLRNCQMNAEQLTTEQIIELLYECYNPITSQQQKVIDPSQLGLV